MSSTIASRPRVRSELARRAAELFDLPIESQRADPPAPPPDDLPAAGEVLLLSGPSGGGKTTRLLCLAALARQRNLRVIDVARVPLRRVPCVDQFGRSGDADADLAFATGQLSRVGLAEARVFLRFPQELSDGERWRLRLAVAVVQVMRHHARAGGDAGGALLIADEFCAVLDRVCACVVARAFRRTVDRLHRVGVNVRATVATSHTDLRPALVPDRVIWCEGFD